MTPYKVLYSMRLAIGTVGAWFRRKTVDRAVAVGLCCTHNAPVHCLVGFLFRKVMQKHYLEVGKQRII